MKKLLSTITLACLLASPMTVHAEKRSTAEATTEFTYTSNSMINIDKDSGSVNTGDTKDIGKWLMMTSGSLILLLLLLYFKRDEEESVNEV